MGQERGMDAVSQAYELHAVILHHGPRANTGHYTAVVNIGTQQSPQWRHFDDARVIVIPTPTGSLSGYLKEQNAEGKTVCMLLYKKPRHSTGFVLSGPKPVAQQRR